MVIIYVIKIYFDSLQRWCFYYVNNFKNKHLDLSTSGTKEGKLILSLTWINAIKIKKNIAIHTCTLFWKQEEGILSYL